MNNKPRNPEYEEVRSELTDRKYTVLYSASDVAHIPEVLEMREFIAVPPQNESIVQDAELVQNYPDFVPEISQNDSTKPEKMSAEEDNSADVAAARALLKDLQG